MPEPSATSATATDYDFIVVGSGAGGAPLAANLARKRYRILLLEAGGWDDPENCQVPALHPLSTEDPQLSWSFYARHYSDNALGQADSKWVNGKGIFYPRAATVGGCTVHNAMITVAGPSSDWDEIADLTGDQSWSGDCMRPYFQRVERCTYQRPPASRDDPGRHGFYGWLTTSWPDVRLALKDRQIVKLLKAVYKAAVAEGIDTPWRMKWDLLRGRVREHFDPNFWRSQRLRPEGLALVPTAVRDGKRSSPRDLLRATQQECGEYLKIQTNALAVQLLFDRTRPRPRATGIKFRKGARLYKAHPEPGADGGAHGGAHGGARGGAEVEVRCKREVILAGGAFNTPQLLMLSGIGPAGEVNRHGIDVVLDLPGVGKNLQDRYEVAVISELPKDFALLADATFKNPGTAPDAALDRWRRDGTGVYASNGVVVGIFKRSQPFIPEPDLFLFALPGYFKGYEPGYSAKIGDHKNILTWAILKAHTRNHVGSVTLRNRDPLEPPEINFRFFADGKEQDPDLDALVEGVRFARQIMKRLGTGREIWPGPSCESDNEVRQWIRREAWGHHACGTCRIGKADDPLAVVDSRFRVRHVDGLRIVDASIFPTIPGLFIVTNLYMASEKAADVIHEDMQGGPDNPLYPRRLADLEAEALAKRRQHAGIRGAEGQPAKSVGFALSGGGVRSATFNLGILQAAAKNHTLREIDYLSTVSGGGYVGGFLGALYARLADDPVQAPNAPAIAEDTLGTPDSQPLTWLRKNANFLSPTGKGNVGLNIGVYLRNFLTLHFVLLVFFFFWYGVANLLRYVVFPWLSGLAQYANPLPIDVALPGPADLPFGHMLFSGLGTFWSPWVMLAEIVLLVWVIPQMLAYWLASQDRPGRFQWQALVVHFILAGGLLFAALNEAGRITLQPLFAVVPFLMAFFWVEQAWRRTAQKVRAAGGTTELVQANMARNYLTRFLGKSLTMFSIVVLFVLVDTAGHGLYRLARAQADIAGWSAKLGAMLLAMLPALRLVAGIFAQPQGRPPTSFRRKALSAVIPLVLFLVVVFLLGVLVSYFAHLAFDGGNRVGPGLILTAAALLISFVFRYAIRLINRTSLQAVYGARLSRTFLGATNSRRQHHPLGQNILEEMPGDDLPFRQYKPYTSGGPIHILNIMLNHTIDSYSLRGVRDRQGDNFAVSPFGLSAGADVHSLWGPRVGEVVALPTSPGKENPFLHDTDDTEELTLSQWIAISGAAVSAGRGRHPNIGINVIMGLANLRTGYWWRSGRRSSGHPQRPPRGPVTTLLETIARFFWPQSLLIYELIGRFGGPWVSYWYLSDAGVFENLGVYELLRRRVPCIVCGDASMDGQFRMDDLGELILKARVDFHAEFTFLTNAELDALTAIPPEVRPYLGALSDLRPSGPNNLSTKHAALARVTYRDDPERQSIFLYIKSSLTGDEPVDVLNYRANHPDFPHETTVDQFFTEPQWESYRMLGEHVGSRFLVRNAQGRLWLMDL